MLGANGVVFETDGLTQSCKSKATQIPGVAPVIAKISVDRVHCDQFIVKIGGIFLATIATSEAPFAQQALYVMMGTIGKCLSPSLPVFYSICNKRAREARYDSYSIDHHGQGLDQTDVMTAFAAFL